MIWFLSVMSSIVAHTILLFNDMRKSNKYTYITYFFFYLFKLFTGIKSNYSVHEKNMLYYAEKNILKYNNN